MTDKPLPLVIHTTLVDRTMEALRDVGKATLLAKCHEAGLLVDDNASETELFDCLLAYLSAWAVAAASRVPAA